VHPRFLTPSVPTSIPPYSTAPYIPPYTYPIGMILIKVGSDKELADDNQHAMPTGRILTNIRNTNTEDTEDSGSMTTLDKEAFMNCVYNEGIIHRLWEFERKLNRRLDRLEVIGYSLLAVSIALNAMVLYKVSK
jgi:hypothetical protein